MLKAIGTVLVFAMLNCVAKKIRGARFQRAILPLKYHHEAPSQTIRTIIDRYNGSIETTGKPAKFCRQSKILFRVLRWCGREFRQSAFAARHKPCTGDSRTS